MRRNHYKYLLFLVICLFVSCAQQGREQTSTTPLTNAKLPKIRQQEEFVDFLTRKNNKFKNIDQDRFKQEFFTNFEKEISSYIDSMGMLVHWVGTINNIKIDEGRDITTATFEINYPCEIGNIGFHCQHLTTSKTAENDYLLERLKTIENNTVIAFDGIIKTSSYGSIRYYKNPLYDSHNLVSPDYQIYVVDIFDAQEMTSTVLHMNMDNAVKSAYNLVDLERSNYLGMLSDEGKKTRSVEAVKALRESMQPLSKEERAYVERLIKSLRYNFRYTE